MRNQRLMACIVAATAAGPLTASAAEITLFEGPNFQGRSMTFTSDATSLDPTGFNDRAASVIVRDGVWEGCADAYFQGGCSQFRPGEYAQLDGQLNRRLSSLRILQGQPSYVGQRNADPGYYARDGVRDEYYGHNRATGYDRGYYGYPYHDHGQ
jgi:ABC-type amino acid transport substrate-binding protein